MIAHSILLKAIVSLALLSGSAAALAMPEQAKDLQARGTRPISVEAACNVFYGTSFSAQTIGNGCYDWVCVRGNERYGLDFNDWCGGEEGKSDRASCSNGVYSWVCID